MKGMKSSTLTVPWPSLSNTQTCKSCSPCMHVLSFVARCPDHNPIGCCDSLCSQFLLNVCASMWVLIWKWNQSCLQGKLPPWKFRGQKVTVLLDHYAVATWSVTSREPWRQLWLLPTWSPESRGHVLGPSWDLQVTDCLRSMTILWIN